MQHLYLGSKSTLSLQELPSMSRVGKVFRVASNYTTCSTACAGPRQFICVLALRPYSPGGQLKALAAPLKDLVSQQLVVIVYGVDYQGI